MVSQSDQVVFVLGAGFSTATGLPLMSDFADAARRRSFELKAREPQSAIISTYDRMFAFKRECERSPGAFLRDWENIEELYTQADLRRLAGLPSKDNCDVACASIAWVL